MRRGDCPISAAILLHSADSRGAISSPCACRAPAGPIGRTSAHGELRQRIRAHNGVVGKDNTAASGYHETLTRLWLHAIASHHAAHGELPLASPAWPLRHDSRERLFSAQARAGWLEPDLAPFEP
jgi:hypothetical protein